MPVAEGKSRTRFANVVAAPEMPADLPHIIASGVSTSVQTAVAAVAAGQINDPREARSEAVAQALDAARDARQTAIDEARDATQEARDAVREKVLGKGRIDQIIEMKAAGVSPEYVNALRASQPRLRALDPANFAGMQVHRRHCGLCARPRHGGFQQSGCERIGGSTRRRPHRRICTRNAERRPAAGSRGLYSAPRDRCVPSICAQHSQVRPLSRRCAQDRANVGGGREAWGPQRCPAYTAQTAQTAAQNGAPGRFAARLGPSDTDPGDG